MTDHLEIIDAREAQVVNWAHALEQDIRRDMAEIRRRWVQLAATLYDFHAGRAWATLGHDTLESWLAGPDIDLSRRTFFELIETYRVLHIERGIHFDEIGRVDLSKAQVVLPAIRRGQVEPMRALADAEALSRTDLREKYRAIPATATQGEADPVDMSPDAFHWESCPTCGSKIKVND